MYIDIAMVNYERRNVGSITASFKPKNLESCEAFRKKMHLVWETPELRSIDWKMCNNYCYVLLDRVKMCEATYPNCEELKKTIRDAYEDYETMKAHGIEDFYYPSLDALFEKYKEIIKK